MPPTWRRRLKLAIAGLLAAAAVAIPALQPADAQTPPVVERLVIVNEDEEKPFVERKKHGEFRARPIFNQRLSRLTYGIRDADSGEWLTAIYRVNGGEDERDEGWEYDFDYPALDEQPDLDPEQRYLLVIAAQAVGHATPTTFYVTIPEHQPGGFSSCGQMMLAVPSTAPVPKRPNSCTERLDAISISIHAASFANHSRRAARAGLYQDLER